MTKTALILVDIQNDYFPDGRWPVDGMHSAGKAAARLLAHARETGQLVIHVRHEINATDAPFFARASVGAQIHSIVQPLPQEKVILKHRPNSFVNTDLLETLDDAGIETLTICGAMSQMCIDATTRGAVDLGFKAVVVADACAAKAVTFEHLTVPAPLVHATIMGALSGTYAQIVTSQSLLQ